MARIYPAVADSVVPSGTIIPFSNNSSNATSVQWLLDGYVSGVTGNCWNYAVGTGLHTISLVAYHGSCTDTATTVYFAAGTAHNVDSLLLAHYGSWKYNEEANCIDKTPDSGFLVGGVQYPWDACGETGVLVKLRQRGCMDWSKKFIAPFYCNYSPISAVYASPDTNYYVLTDNVDLTKLDRNGNLVWTKKYLMNGQYTMSIQSVMTGDKDGSVYLLCNSNGLSYFNGWGLAKLDKNGNMVWNKLFRLSYEVPASVPTGAQYEYATPSGMVWLNGKIFVCGNAYSNSNKTYFSFLTRVDATTGTKDWQYGYADPEFPGAVGFVHLSLYDTILMASSGAQGQMVSLIDQQGAVRKSIKTKFATSYGPKVTKAAADSKGHIYMMQWTEESLSLQPYYWYATNLAEIDTSLNKYWGAVFSEYSRPNFVDGVMGLDDQFAAVGTHYGKVTDGVFESRDIRFLKLNTVNADQFCYNTDNSYEITQKTINRLNFQFLIDTLLTLTTGIGTTYQVVDAFLESRYNCPDFVDSCSFLKLSGPVNLCSLGETYTYRIHRNKKCALIPQWQLPAGVAIASQTDSTLSLRFSGFGTYTISARLNGCTPVKDSLVINIASKSHPLYLGSDTSLCKGATIKLHASADFFSYQWSDGSTDSVLQVTQPGLYWVETIDSCNNHLRDSISIRPFYLPIDIGPDRTKCNNDTVHLNAPGGFLSYAWSNNYNISAANAQNVVVNPSMDTAYYLQAEKLPGCFAYDTIQIHVNTSPPIHLGADTSFCRGDSVVFYAATGFNTYLWSNGVTSAQITAKTAGSYSVTGIDNNGCKSYDTIRVLTVFPNPAVILDHDPSLCYGSTRTLDAGNFSSYVWSDGSTSRKISVDGIGSYTVEVTDNNGCKGRDTSRITTLLPLPSNFLPADTLLCSYDKLRLTSQNTYKSYQWSTGAASSSVTITQPGVYWLEVNDNNDCKGRDSIMIEPKDCMKGIYVPTAFSPNKDGRNDVFRPLLFGNVTKYQFTVYNRWGQVVFQTTELNKAWDGNFGGKLQEANVFVWVCVYQFEGEQIKTARGSVMLVQ
ncbi:MAG: T9SS type B sorting domain-containing protein [Flavisolibacter sp.]